MDLDTAFIHSAFIRSKVQIASVVVSCGLGRIFAHCSDLALGRGVVFVGSLFFVRVVVRLCCCVRCGDADCPLWVFGW